MTKIIFLNGPPESGKDTIGAGLQEHLENLGYLVEIDKFAQPIRDAACVTFPHVTEENLDSLKGKEIYPGSSTTLRKWMIRFSDIMKETCGNDVFGKLAFERLRQRQYPLDFLIFTDCGFASELHVFRENKVSHLNLFHVIRNGKTFREDSRNYVSLPTLPAKALFNPEASPDLAIDTLTAFLEEKRWV